MHLIVRLESLPPNWIQVSTKTADANGMIIFADAPAGSGGSFWRVRSVP